MKKDKNIYPVGWDESRVRRVLDHYENQTEDEAVAEAEAAFGDPNQTTMAIPKELVSMVRELIAKHQKENTEGKRSSRGR